MTHDPDAGRKMRDAIEEYASRQEASAVGQASHLDAVLACFVPDHDSAMQLQKLVVDSVFRYLFAAGRQLYDSTGGNDALFDNALEHFLKLKTRLTGDSVRHFRRYVKQAVLTSLGPRPKREVRERMMRKQENKKCYICGATFVSARDGILDHVWPHSAGGGTGKSNLRRAHEECEAAKADLALCADASVGRFAFINLPRQLQDRAEPWWPRTIDSSDSFRTFADGIRASQMRIALLRRQDFKCYRCFIDLSDAGEAIVERRNDDEPWWFPNTIIVCITCRKGVASCRNT